MLEGRSDSDWIDYNFFGHQLVCHLSQLNNSETNNVDGKEVPIPHFGIVLEWSQFEEFEEQLRAAKIKFIIEPYVRFKGLSENKKRCFLKILSGMRLNLNHLKMMPIFLLPNGLHT